MVWGLRGGQCLTERRLLSSVEAPPSSSDEDEDVQLEPEDYKQVSAVDSSRQFKTVVSVCSPLLIAAAAAQSRIARPIKSSAKKTGGGGGRSNVTLRDLVEAKLLEPGEDCIVVTYKGMSYTASLSDDCAIVYSGAADLPSTSWLAHLATAPAPAAISPIGCEHT